MKNLNDMEFYDVAENLVKDWLATFRSSDEFA